MPRTQRRSGKSRNRKHAGGRRPAEGTRQARRPRQSAGPRAPRAASGAGGRREVWLALAALVALLCVAYANVIFDGRSLVYSNGVNPLDYRYLPQNFGPGFEPFATWEN